jgi:signal transduction histidine kinase
MATWAKRIETWPKPLLVSVSLGLLAFIGCLDYITGYKISFFILYLIPVIFSLRYVGFTFAIATSVLSAIVWVVSNMLAGQTYPNNLIPIWNGGWALVLYVGVVNFLTLREKLEERVRQRTAEVTHEMHERRRLEKELLEASELEQRRIGHDLHDSLCQHLTGTALAGQVLGKKLEDKSLPEAAAANHLVRLLEEGIDLTRKIARGLHPVEMQAETLEDNFQQLAANASERFNVSCKFECPQPVLLQDAGTITHLYRITQEAITNAVRHGKSRRINVCLDSADDEIVLTVTDDGTGLPKNASNNHGMGLRIMAYRASMIGGVFNIERLSSGGTRVTCTLSAIPETHGQKK